MIRTDTPFAGGSWPLPVRGSQGERDAARRAVAGMAARLEPDQAAQAAADVLAHLGLLPGQEIDA